jgi:hypothetical protein
MPDGPGAVFAISKLILGQTDPSGAMNKELWKSIGYNLDHTVTTTTSAGVIVGENVCARIQGADFSMVADGHDGRDNAFGSKVMPLVLSFNGFGEKPSNDLVRLGKHTLLVDVQGLGESPTYESMTARIYEGRSFVDMQGMTATPKFDGTDVWPIAFESVANGAPESPLATSNDAYVAEEGDGGTFVGHFGGSIVLTLDVFALPDEQGVMQLRIHEPLVTMRLSADRSRVESGTLAGFIETAETEVEVGRLVGVFDATLCNSSPPAVALRNQFRQSSDILRHGLKDKTKPCESISFGIQFEATRAQLGSVTAPAAPPPDPCAVP